MTKSNITLPEIISREEWREEHKELLKRKKNSLGLQEAGEEPKDRVITECEENPDFAE